MQEVVGTTFEQEVLKNANDVVLCFYSPWGEHSDYFHPIYEELAAQVRERQRQRQKQSQRICEVTRDFVFDLVDPKCTL